ncbi:MAG: DUF3369 domain-containing protein [Fibrobacterales bacterium]
MTTYNSSDPLFADDPAGKSTDDASLQTPKFSGAPWKILIVDDDEGIHDVTKIVLKDFIFDGRPLEFLSALSGEDAKSILLKHQDIAVLYLDVVMETNDAGLQLVKYIRDELENKTVRIILRTGQPGMAPESHVIQNYDINDYRSKEELTSQKLMTSLFAALRSYRDIETIDTYKRGLEKLLLTSSSLFKPQSMQKFASIVLEQMVSLLNLEHDALYCQAPHHDENSCADDFVVLASTGKYSGSEGMEVSEVVSGKVEKDINSAIEQMKSMYNDVFYLGYFKTSNGAQNIIYLKGWSKLETKDKMLIDVFCANLSVAFENIYQNMEYVDTQKEIFYTMSEIAESRSHETSNHVKRVSSYAALLAQKMGLSEAEVEMLKLATPMHDIGKLAIPEAILHKPGSLTTDEFEVVKTHAQIGFDMLNNSKREVFRVAAMIAHQHQEKFDGSGYPNALKADEIHIYSRITTIVDVFDALSYERCYKPAWSMDKIVDYMNSQKGAHFDPNIAEIFLENLSEFIAIQKRLPDIESSNQVNLEYLDIPDDEKVV